MVEALSRQAPAKLNRLTSALSSVIDDYMIVSFVMLDNSDEESIEDVLARTDHAIQYGMYNSFILSIGLVSLKYLEFFLYRVIIIQSLFIENYSMKIHGFGKIFHG